ncbi:uncharacterized protein GIQ15_01893 [Arthroderma uncinatum]|uniref:uncharacterized protein n=1 Tax=Arthroderma uncinatum TaxID=74035 RepID=UPI00144AB1BA|nr:uncharacterized protein GIQ15_01893 [Arthroderma uncinatum]KAF3492376.1 hypothetical protein GIQ15_01893 [Arthroderma uncinatum]
METIPQELFLSILEYIEVNPKRFMKYVTVSRRWQRAIERFYFNRIRVNESELSSFAELFRETESHRKSLVKQLFLKIHLPAYDGDNYHQHKEVNNQIFSTTILKLFQVLETFDGDEDVKRNRRKGDGLQLTITYIKSPCDDFDGDDAIKLRGTYIQLLNHQKLPTLSCVSTFFSGCHDYTRMLDPASGILIAGKLKNLKRCTTDYYDRRECINNETRKIIRPAFANALSLYTQSLGAFDLRMEFSCPLDDASSPPNYALPSSRVDPMNLALDAPVPFWPNMRDIYVWVAPTTPDGDWYFMGDPNIASHPEFIGATRADDQTLRGTEDTCNFFRIIPIPERMNPLLIAMARAVRYAPSIEAVGVRFVEAELSPKYVKTKGSKRQFGIFYCAPGTEPPFGSGLSVIRRPSLICDVQDWRLDEDIEKYWMEALGPDGSIVYVNCVPYCPPP